MIRRCTVGFDLGPLPIGTFTPVVIGCDVDMKNEAMLLQVVVPFLGDMRSKVPVTTIWGFDGGASQNAGN